MSSGSSLKGSFIIFIVLGAIGMLIRYLFGGDGNRFQIHQTFIDVFNILWWIAKYILIPLCIIGLIAQLFNKSNNDDKPKL